MINLEFFEKLSKIFCGDELDLFIYKTGPDLVRFFNNNFKSNDSYGEGFPTRWRYVNQKLLELENNNKISDFLNVILSKKYILIERQTNEIDALKHQQKIINKIGKMCSIYSLKLFQKDGRFQLVEVDLDLVEIGKGGFATIYYQKSTGLVMKKLSEESSKKRELRSRFKREYEITKSCSDIDSIIRVFDFDSENCSYTMEKADSTLDTFIKENPLSYESQVNVVRQILCAMSLVHEKNVLHRDLSSTNIFLVKNKIKLADFGLGKNIDTLTSHQTVDTASYGQLYYCAPEQLTRLKEADKRSDVYSLGRIINFILTTNPDDFSHPLGPICEKATNLNPDYRYKDATHMLEELNDFISLTSDKEYEKKIWKKISNQKFDSDVENYISSMRGKDLCKNCIQKGTDFIYAIVSFMHTDKGRANNIIQSIDYYYIENLKEYEYADVFVDLSYLILKEEFSYPVKEVAAKILRYLAESVGRYKAQHKIEDLIDGGIDPLLEDILNANTSY